MTLDELNHLSFEAAYTGFQTCCASKRWIDGMMNARPFSSSQHVLDAADTIWKGLTPSDWKEAFAHHPKIGDDERLRERFGASAALAESEQSGVKSAAEETLRELAIRNQEYEARFGYIFIVCATGKTAAEMLDLLSERIGNDPENEIWVAAEEQSKIMKLRLEKLLT